MAPKGKPSAGDESSGNRRGNPPATYRSPGSAEEEDGGYPETVMFPPAPARGGSGGQEEEYPTTMAFPPPMAEPADDDGGYPETVMFPPQKQKAAGRPPVDDDGGYPETVMFPPQQPGRPPVDDGGYPETVMFPPRQPGGQADDGYQETVQYPPRRPGGQRNDARQSRPPPPPPPPFQPETVEFPPRGPVPQRNDRRQPEAVSWPPPPQPPIRPPPPRPTTPAMAMAMAPGNPWNSQLFDCGLDSNNAVITAIFPCVTFGQIAEIVDQGQTSCVMGGFMYGLLMPILLCSLLGATYRVRLRQMYNLSEAPGDEWILHIFCPFCALCQEYRELYSRGLDPSLGWAAIAAGQGQQMNQRMTPPKMMPPMHR
ncbi:uncharacterized protein LOC141816370 [Curcuma longa]|uniref:uncharacterized protein LOC141816370 n=1 Tax=Curcuma longa TaxID=136217 RepID=UPI003D9ED6A4